MTLEVFTARISTRDADAFDITRKSGRGDGLAFAPSWAILGPALDARRRAEALMREAFEALAIGEDEWTPAREAERIAEEAWAQYVPAFMAEMRASYRANRAAWDRLLGRDRVVLVCYCSDQRCHRVLLARDILPRLGAVYRGELEEPKERGLFDAPHVAAGG